MRYACRHFHCLRSCKLNSLTACWKVFIHNYHQRIVYHFHHLYLKKKSIFINDCLLKTWLLFLFIFVCSFILQLWGCGSGHKAGCIALNGWSPCFSNPRVKVSLGKMTGKKRRIKRCVDAGCSLNLQSTFHFIYFVQR